MRIYSQLIDDMQRDYPSTSSNRLTWILFRDIALREIFKRALALVRSAGKFVCGDAPAPGFSGASDLLSGSSSNGHSSGRRPALSADDLDMEYSSPPRPGTPSSSSRRAPLSGPLNPVASTKSPPPLNLVASRRFRRLSADDADASSGGMRGAGGAEIEGVAGMLRLWDGFSLDDPEAVQVLQSALQVVLGALCYDFSGGAADSTADEETLAVAVPSSWGVLRSCSIPQLFFDLYFELATHPAVDNDGPEAPAPTCLRILVQLAALRSSFFEGEQRREHIGVFLRESSRVMLSHSTVGHADAFRPDTFHELARLLFRIKSCWSLHDLSVHREFSRWIGVLTSLTTWAFESWQFVPSRSAQYLLQLWAALVQAARNHTADTVEINEAVPSIIRQFLDSRMQLAACGEGADYGDDFVDEDGAVVIQMEAFAPLGRHHLAETTDYVCSSMDDLLSRLADRSESDVEAIQRQLTCMTTCVGAMVRHMLRAQSSSCVTKDVLRSELMTVPNATHTGQLVLYGDTGVLDPFLGTGMDSRTLRQRMPNVATSDDDDADDHTLEERLLMVSRMLAMPFRVLLLMRGGGSGVGGHAPLVDMGGEHRESLGAGAFVDIEDVLGGLNSRGGAGLSAWDETGPVLATDWTAARSRLEESVLYFMEVFRQVYLSERESSDAASVSTRDMGLSSLVAAASGVRFRQSEPPSSPKGPKGVLSRIASLLGMHRVEQLLDLIVEKLADNLQSAAGPMAGYVLKQSLSVFHDLCASVTVVQRPQRASELMSSGIELLHSPTIRAILREPVAEMFAALNTLAFVKLRTSLYATLGRLMFLHAASVTQQPLLSRGRRRRDKPISSASGVVSRTTAQAPSASGRSSRMSSVSGSAGSVTSFSPSRGERSSEPGGDAAVSEMFLLGTDESSWFTSFVAPLSHVGGELLRILAAAEAGDVESSSEALRFAEDGSVVGMSDEFRVTTVGWLRDVRGVVHAAQNLLEYRMVHEWLFPDYNAMFMLLVSLFSNRPSVMVPLLRLLVELATNRNARMKFSPISAAGLITFRECSRVVCAYGSRVLGAVQASSVEGSVEDEPYTHRFKPTSLALTVGTRLLTGDYANLGIFDVYEDPCFEDLRRIMVQLVVDIPMEHLSQHVKVQRRVFPALQALAARDAAFILQLAPEVLAVILEQLHFGVRSTTSLVSSYANGALNDLATARFEALRTVKDEGTPALAALTTCQRRQREVHERVAASLTVLDEVAEGLWVTLTNSLFDTVLYEPKSNQWSISRPLLPLILVDTSQFEEYARTLSESVGPSVVPAMKAGVTKILEMLEPRLDNQMRRQFTVCLYDLVRDVRDLL